MAITELPALAQRIGYTVSASASVWGDNGPTIILVEEGPTAVYVAMRHGTTASVRHTATGKVFAAFGPRERAAAALAAEGFAGALDEPAFAAELEAVRQHLEQLPTHLHALDPTRLARVVIVIRGGKLRETC